MKNNVLIISPHADDGELGCGATVVKLINEGMVVHYIAFSIGEETIPDGIDKTIMLLECQEATKTLGIFHENLIIKRFPIRRFNSCKIEILKELIELRNRIFPQIVFMPSSQSLHQDHKTIYNEAVRVFKHTTCYGYDLPWDTANFITSSFFILDHKHLTIKIAALKKYHTLNQRIYMDEKFIEGLARVRGAQIGVKYAEAFEIIRLVF